MENIKNQRQSKQMIDNLSKKLIESEETRVFFEEMASKLKQVIFCHNMKKKQFHFQKGKFKFTNTSDKFTKKIKPCPRKL